jgi:hypothetical protein
VTARELKRRIPRKAAVAAAFLLILPASVAYAAVFGAPTDSPQIFELDGNAVDNTLPSGVDRNLPDDWSAIFPPPADTPVGFLDASFVDDHAAVDQTYFFGGSSKDDINIDTTPSGSPTSGGWLRDATSSAQAKADIIDSFAASYAVDDDANPLTPAKTVVYFGMDRFSNDGATFAGFWFLQNPITLDPNTANNGVGEIHGTHKVGDILVITDFTQGGAVANLNVYEWVGSGGAINGVFNLLFAGTDCSVSGSTALACSIVNSSAQPSPWSFVPKSNVGPAGTFQPGLFIEGGINISDLFPGEDPCFTNFVSETRASFSVDSTLSDFTAGNFNTCGGIEALKYHDRNADGVRDADGVDNVAGNGDDESPLSGWTIFIDLNGNETLDAGEQSAVTGTDGKVTFTGLSTGAYSVCEKISDQTGWFNSDPTGPTLCQTANVGTGGAVVSIDFGNYQNGTKSGFKYEDKDANDAFDGSDVKLAGWVIKAIKDDNGDGQLDAAELSDMASYTTDVTTGAYSFSLAPGKYFVCEEAQKTGETGWNQSSPKTGDTSFTAECDDQNATAAPDLAAGGYYITVTSGSSDTDNEFGNYKNGTKSGFKYEDKDANDNFNGSDVKLAGWVVDAIRDDNGDGQLDAAELSDMASYTTDATTGAYTFSLAPGKYFVCEEAQKPGETGWLQSSPETGDTGFTAECDDQNATANPDLAPGGYYITVTSQSTDTNNEFGNFKQATKAGVKFHDRNADGVRDANGVDDVLGDADDEVLLSGWEIHLFGTDGQGNAVHLHAITDSNGAYSFSVNPGVYDVCEAQQTGWAQTYPVGGGSPTPDSQACPTHPAGGGGSSAAGGQGWHVTLTSGQQDTNNNFGNRELYRLIVLTCSEASGLLVQSTVDLDGNLATTGDTKTTIGTPPGLGTETTAALQAYLCGLGGAQYNNLVPQTFSTILAIVPKPV